MLRYKVKLEEQEFVEEVYEGEFETKAQLGEYLWNQVMDNIDWDYWEVEEGKDD